MIILTPTSTAVVLPWPETCRGDQAHPMSGPRLPEPTYRQNVRLGGLAADLNVVVRKARVR
jgi:hypothetical protein